MWLLLFIWGEIAPVDAAAWKGWDAHTSAGTWKAAGSSWGIVGAFCTGARYRLQRAVPPQTRASCVSLPILSYVWAAKVAATPWIGADHMKLLLSGQVQVAHRAAAACIGVGSSHVCFSHDCSALG